VSGREVEGMCKEAAMAYFETTFQYLPAGTEQNYRKPQSG
jgi:hypothetical protein